VNQLLIPSLNGEQDHHKLLCLGSTASEETTATHMGEYAARHCPTLVWEQPAAQHQKVCRTRRCLKTMVVGEGGHAELDVALLLW
jgi:hypothetical protein